MRTPRLHTSTMLSCACQPEPKRRHGRPGSARQPGAREVGLPGEPRRASDRVLLRTPRLPSYPSPTILPSGDRLCVLVGRAHLALDHLGRQVVERAAEGRAARMRRVHRPTKVCNLELSPEIEQQVLWLDIAVDHVLRVAVVERAGQRLDVLPQQGQRW